MTPGRGQDLKDVIARALELSLLDRQAFLRKACGDDETLLTELTARLAAEERPTVVARTLSTVRKRPGPFALGDSLLNGRFHLLDLLGSGSVGTVYRALDGERNETVALKVLHSREPDLVARFKNEFRSLQGTHHTNLVRIDEMFEVEETCFFSMEFVEGPNFLEYVRTSKPVGATYNPSRLLPSLLQLCEGISALHHAGQVAQGRKARQCAGGPGGARGAARLQRRP